jgi:hypothetical protein
MLWPVLRTASAFLLLASAALLATPSGATVEGDEPRKWGAEALTRIDADFWLPARDLYADAGVLGQPAPDRPAFMWGCSVQLATLAAAAQIDPGYQPRLKRYLAGLKSYWVTHQGLSGFNALPAPSPPDRYYDDNAWMVLALLDAYAATRDGELLRLAEDAYRFVLSGDDPQLGGGI